MSVPVKPKIGSYKRHVLVCTGPRCAEDGVAQTLLARPVALGRLAWKRRDGAIEFRISERV